jgi:hypothetical protein
VRDEEEEEKEKKVIDSDKIQRPSVGRWGTTHSQ